MDAHVIEEHVAAVLDRVADDVMAAVRADEQYAPLVAQVAGEILSLLGKSA
jgi:hypothetical protein